MVERIAQEMAQGMRRATSVDERDEGRASRAVAPLQLVPFLLLVLLLQFGRVARILLRVDAQLFGLQSHSVQILAALVQRLKKIALESTYIQLRP